MLLSQEKGKSKRCPSIEDMSDKEWSLSKWCDNCPLNDKSD